MFRIPDRHYNTVYSETYRYDSLLLLEGLPYYRTLLNTELGIQMEEPPRSEAAQSLAALYEATTEEDTTSVETISEGEHEQDQNVTPEATPSREPAMVRPLSRAMSKYWVFTEQHVHGPFDMNLKKLLENGKVTYCIFQYEVAPRTGKEHLQGYVEFSVRKRLQWVKRHMSDTAHWERLRGTRSQARDYCMKEETRKPGTEPFEFGTFIPTQQGKRNDLWLVKEKLDSGLPLVDVAKQDDTFHTVIRYFKGLEWFQQQCMLKGKPRTGLEPILVEVYYGKPGCGKTWLARQSYPDAYWKPAQTKWWDGYKGETVAIFDDFNHGWDTWDKFMTIIDRYPCKVEVKGGFMELCVRHFVITTNTHPRLWYKNMGDKFAALARRIHKVLVFDKETTGVFEEMTLLEVPLPMNFSLSDIGVTQRGIPFND